MRVRHSHGEAYHVALFMLINRYRQRYGGYIVHLGLVMLALGVIGSHFFQVQQDAVLKPGQEMNVAGYKLAYFGNVEETGPGTDTVKAILQVWRDGQMQHYIYPGREFYQNFGNQPASLISISTFGLTDVYVLLDDWQGASQATIRVFINPLTSLVWYGGLVMLLGGVICWWPERRRQPAPARERTRPRPVGATLVVALANPSLPPQGRSSGSQSPVESARPLQKAAAQGDEEVVT